MKRKFSLHLCLILLTYLLMNLSIKAEIVTKSFTMSNDCYSCFVEEGNNLVFINCDEDACTLICIGGGDVECCWECVQGCVGCIESIDLLHTAGGEDMFDYVHNQISLQNYVGQYTNNIVYFPTNTFYYRTIHWNYNPQSDEFTSTLSISYEN